MNKNNLPIYFSLAIILGILIGTFFNFNKGSNQLFSSTTSNEMKIKRLIHYIQRDYVDTVNTDALLDDAITQILKKLDPHSVYIPKENLQRVKENMQGNFVGIGVQFRVISDSITVIQPLKNGPSIEAGIKAGDRILIADSDTLYNKKLTTQQIMSILKGKPNTELSLQVYRKMNDSLFSVKLKRGKIPIKSVEVSYMLNDSVGYIKLERFARTTYDEFKAALTKLQKNKMTDLVLDLRGNGGGYIDIANQIADEFLEDEKLIVFTKDNKGNEERFYATNKGSFEKGGLYVLIDENTASASEIVSGALQDNDKGTIIGRRSFGKGLVQEELGLGDGSAVRLTIARYYTPTGRSIQRPYEVGKFDEYYSDPMERVGQIFADSLQQKKDSLAKHGKNQTVADSLVYKTPKGKVVYGGGGITPDIFVGLDENDYLNGFYFGAINNFSFEYVDTNRGEVSKISLNDFMTTFDIDKVYQLFLGEKNQNKPDKKTESKIKKYLKASIASQLFGDEGFYKVLQIDDKMLLKVLELETNN